MLLLVLNDISGFYDKESLFTNLNLRAIYARSQILSGKHGWSLFSFLAVTLDNFRISGMRGRQVRQ